MAKKSKSKAPAVTKSKKKFCMVSCTHAGHINQRAWRPFLEDKKDFKPDFTAHLGDFLDTTAFRSGAEGTADEMADPEADLECGLFHLQQLEPDLVLCGNHEERLWRFINSPNARAASYAHRLITDISAVCQTLGAEMVEYDGIWSGRMMGPAFLTHGTIYNENAARDMAEMYGGHYGIKYVFFGHTHTKSEAMARSLHGCMGVNIGAMTDRREMGYAKNRRKTFSWVNCAVFGEYTDNHVEYWIKTYEQESATAPIPQAIKA